MANHTINACVGCGADIGEDAPGPLCDLCECEATSRGRQFAKGERVRVYVTSGNYCGGWVEFVEGRRVGVRLVNGNFRWCRPQDVKAEPTCNAIDPFNSEGRP